MNSQNIPVLPNLSKILANRRENSGSQRRVSKRADTIPRIGLSNNFYRKHETAFNTIITPLHVTGTYSEDPMTFATIGDAINWMHNNDNIPNNSSERVKIRVSAGEYIEDYPIVVPKWVSIKRENLTDVVTVKPNYPVSPEAPAEGNIIIFNLDKKSIIRGITVDATPEEGVNLDSANVFAFVMSIKDNAAAAALLYDCNSVGAKTCGYYVQDTSARLRCENCTVTNSAYGFVAVAGGTIKIVGDTTTATTCDMSYAKDSDSTINPATFVYPCTEQFLCFGLIGVNEGDTITVPAPAALPRKKSSHPQKSSTKNNFTTVTKTVGGNNPDYITLADALIDATHSTNNPNGATGSKPWVINVMNVLTEIIPLYVPPWTTVNGGYHTITPDFENSQIIDNAYYVVFEVDADAVVNTVEIDAIAEETNQVYGFVMNGGNANNCIALDVNTCGFYVTGGTLHNCTVGGNNIQSVVGYYVEGSMSGTDLHIGSVSMNLWGAVAGYVIGPDATNTSIVNAGCDAEISLGFVENNVSYTITPA